MQEKEIIRNTDVFQYSKTIKRTKRCRLCLMNIKGEDQKLKKNKLKKVTSQCQRCGEAFCNEHCIQTCLRSKKKRSTKGTI